MISVDEDEVEGILKLNSRILESHELKKLDKSERGILNLNAITQKGKWSYKVYMRPFIG